MQENGITTTKAPAETESFPLDDAAIESLAELDQQDKLTHSARLGILGYFLKQHKLTGNWQLSPNRRELVKAAAALPIPTQEG
jgi:hypothetical protein